MATIDNVIARVQKLRSLSKSTNEYEAANAAAAAAKLIDQHQLSEMDLQIKGEKAAEEIVVIEKPLFRTGRIMLWMSQLGQVLASHYGCSVYIGTVNLEVDITKPAKGSRDTEKAMKMVGRPSDAEVVQYMFDWLRPVIIELTKIHAYGQGMAYSQNYAFGVVKGIETQLKAQHETAKREAAAAGQSQAMVLLDNRTALSKTFMDTKLRLRKSVGSKLRGNADAMARGQQAGQNITLTKGLGTSSSNKLLK